MRKGRNRKGRIKVAPCQPHSPLPSFVTEAQLQYTMTTKNTVLRAYVMLAGAMGPIEVLRHFQDRFIMESNSLMKKGYSLGSGQDHLCSHAAWMQSPLEADTSSERLADLGAAQGSPRSSGSGSNTTSLTSASGEPPLAPSAPEPYVAPPAYFREYKGLIMIRDVSEPNGLPTVRATVPYWPLHNAWFLAETNPYRHRLWPRGFSVLDEEEPVVPSVRTRSGRATRKPRVFAPS